MSIKRKKLIEDLQVVANSLGTSGFILAFQCFHIKHNVLFATDGATSIKKTLEYDTGVDCSIFGMAFLTTLQNIKNEDITLEQENNKLILVAEKIEGEFTIVSEAKGVKIPSYTPQESVDMLFEEGFMKALGECKFAASRDETQGSLCGVYVDEKYVYATDRFQIMRHTIGYDCETKGMIFPIKLIEILEKVWTKDSTIRVVKGDTILVFVDSSTVLEGCTLSGKFPLVAEQFVDFGDLCAVGFDRTSLKEVIERHIVFQKGVLDIDRSTTIELEGVKAYLQTVDPNVGSLVEEVDIIQSFNDLVSFKINPVFLKMAIKEGSELFFSPSNELILIRSKNFEYLAKIR
jgi:DNA polymerase III sliding clamp (beta) subunit (PCNA family)